jgi:CSLREA domain-containing protein
MLVAMLFSLLFGAGLAHAATFTVNTADDHDDGTCNVADCTLREAINAANAGAGGDTITFNIPGTGGHTINATLGGFPITKPVTIDGTTQPGFSGTPLIELNGAGAGANTGVGFSGSAFGSVIKGLIINRFGSYGINTDGASITVQGCFIGTNAAGTAAQANAAGGIRLNGGGNLIGGTTAPARNVISGNTSDGIDIVSGGSTIQGNLIGTNAAGSAAVANSGKGIFVNNANNSMIGGTAAGAGNVVSGNSGYGIVISGNSATNNQVQGNLIGTNASGTAKVPNGSPGNTGGITVGGSNNTIGGTAAGARNVISGNNNQGIDLAGTANLVQGNFIGPDITGSVALGNLGSGIAVGGSNHLIGGTSAAARNVISGNGAVGVFLCSCVGPGSGIQVQGNYIGVRVDGMGALANARGVLIAGLSNNTIGGTAAGASNLISDNGGAGVAVASTNGGSTGNAILGNSIFSNGGLGIDLNNDGIVNPNDNCDADTGANNLQNYPVLTSATAGATNTTIQGTINSTANTQFRIEFFSNSSCNSSGNGEGQTFLGSTTVMTNGSCTGSFMFVVPNASLAGTIITATATDAGNNTSEFSACLGVANAQTLQFSASTYSVTKGDPNNPRVNIGVTRTGDTTSSASVGYSTIDDAGLQNCNVFNGTASPRCDYENTMGTLTWAAGDATLKTFSVAIVADSYAKGTLTFRVALSNQSGASLGAPSTATVTIFDNPSLDGPNNPIDNTNFFVRQQYLDFLGREPDPPGFAGWTNTINNCSGDTTQCDRIHVSQLFFQSAEFQDRGYFVYRFYPVAFGRKPDYAEFVPDLASVSGFLDANQLEAAKVAFIAAFMNRPAFVSAYNSLNNTQYVDTLLNTAGVTLSSRQAMIDGLNNATLTRAQVLRQIVESAEVSTKYNHQAYAVMEYFGYLRRQPDAFYLQWIQVLDQSNDPRGMVTGFVNSSEYRSRFGP